MDRDQIKDLIRSAFESVERPANWMLRRSNEGAEPSYVEEEFQDKNDWRTLTPVFLDQSPRGFSSALSFFSDEAFRYFLPAYLIADLDGGLQSADVVFRLCHGLDNMTADDKVNPRRYGARTWFEERRHQFSVFSREQARAILAYLRYKAQHDYSNRALIEQAVAKYWSERAA